MPKDEFFSEIMDGKSSFYLAGWDCPDGSVLSVFQDCLHSRDEDRYGTFNEGGYSNTRLDSIIEATNLTMDPVERLLLYETAQEIGMNDLPWIPLHIEYNLYGLSDDVSYTPSINKLITLRTIFPK